MAANQDVFPKGRFSLELVDVLLDAPCVFPLTDSVVTIGISGDNSWNLPLERMGLETVKHWLKPSIYRARSGIRTPLLTLEYRPETETWEATKGYNHQRTRTGPLDFMDRKPLDCSVWNAAFSRLEPGSRFQVRLPHNPYSPDDFGFFTLILHDCQKPPSTFTERLASLPDVPLGIIASYLHPVHCVRHLCSFGQSVAVKLRAAGVQWPGLCFVPMNAGDGIERLPVVENFLDCLRVAKLLRNGEFLETFFLGFGENSVWQDEKAAKKLLFAHVKKFIYAPKLQQLGLDAHWLPRVSRVGSAPLPESLRTMIIESEGCEDPATCGGVWEDISKLKLAPSTEVTVHFKVFFLGGEESTLTGPIDDSIDSACPNVTKVHTAYCGHGDFLPLNGLTNLRELTVTMWSWDDDCLPSDRLDAYESVIEHFKASSFPSLEKVKLEVRISEGDLRDFLDALATAAPNLEVVEINSIFKSDDPSRLQSSAMSINELPHLRHLKMSFNLWAEVGLQAVLEFCLAINSTVSIIEFNELVCEDMWSPGVKRISESLRQSGRKVTVTHKPEREAKNPIRLPNDLHLLMKKRFSCFDVVVCD